MQLRINRVAQPHSFHSCNKVNVIDTTGAGDMYAAGFLAGLINGYDLKKCGELGTCLAGNVIQNLGAKLKEEQWNQIHKVFSH